MIGDTGSNEAEQRKRAATERAPVPDAFVVAHHLESINLVSEIDKERKERKKKEREAEKPTAPRSGIDS